MGDRHKAGTGKLTLAVPVDVLIPTQLQQNGFRIMPIRLKHTLRVATLPFHHRDLFDRSLITQSLGEAMPILSVDSVLDAYGVTRLF